MASQTEAQYIVFCASFHGPTSGQHPRETESARDPAGPSAQGCSMADMATLEQVEDAWEQLETLSVLDKRVPPITYMNSAAAIKAFCGRNEACSAPSSNAVPLFRSSYLRGIRQDVLFPRPATRAKYGRKIGIPLD